MKRFKKIIIATIAAGFLFTLGLNQVNAETTVKQKAHYDTFVFYVNGKVPMINDIALKPFIANNRTYVPIRTLSDLGIAKLTWTPGQGGLPATLSVMPSGDGDEQKISDLKATNDALAVNNSNLQKQVNDLTNENAKLKKELEDLKAKKEEKKKDEKGDSKYRDPRDKETENLVRDIDRKLRDRYYSLLDIDRDAYKVDYDVRYRRGFDIEVVIKNMKDEALTSLKKDDRRLVRLLEDVSEEIRRDFRDTTIDFAIYNNDLKSKIGSYTYEIDKDGKSRYGLEGRLDR